MKKTIAMLLTAATLAAAVVPAYATTAVTVEAANQNSAEAQTVFNCLFNNASLNLNNAAVCGIMGNIYQETGFRANIYAGSNNYYYGLCMWGGSRRDNLFAFCSQNGLDPASYEGQCAFIAYELTGGYSNVLAQLQTVPNSAEGVAQAAAIFCQGFEKCGNYGVENPRRANFGLEYWSVFANVAKAGTQAAAAPAETPAASTTDVSSLPVATNETGTDMYRLYNPNTGEHFYTSNTSERNQLVTLGWNYEGIGWTSPPGSSYPVYRMYNPYSGDHHYTLDAAERDNLVSIGWNYEGVGWYSEAPNSKPIYRAFNPNETVGTHNYTTSASEQAYLASIGWVDEGIAWYGVVG